MKIDADTRETINVSNGNAQQETSEENFHGHWESFGMGDPPNDLDGKIQEYYQGRIRQV
jgi:hypothetical protein